MRKALVSKRIRFAVIALLLVISLNLTGCGRKPAKKIEPPKTKLGVSVASMDRDGSKSLKKVFDERKKGGNVDITWVDAQNDPNKQQQDIDKLVKEKVKVVLLQAVNPTVGVVLAEKLLQQNIRVLALDPLPPNTSLDGYLAYDGLRAGELQGEYLLEQAKLRQQPLKVLILQGDKDDVLAQEITKGNLTKLQGNQAISLIGVIDHPLWDEAKAGETVRNYLLSGRRVDAILANSSQLAMAAVDELGKLNMDRQVITLGVNGDKQAMQAIADGKHEGEVEPLGEMLGNLAYEAMVDLAEKDHWQFDRLIRNGNFDVPAKVVPVRLVTKDNIYLAEQRWGKLKPRQGGQQQEQQGQGQRENKQDQQQGQDQGQQSKQGGESSEGGSSQGSGQGGQGGEKTILKITTKDGKTMSIEIDGEIKEIKTEKPK